MSRRRFGIARDLARPLASGECDGAPRSSCCVAGGSRVSGGAPGENRFVRIDSIVVNAVQSPRIPARAAVEWCGVGQPTALDRKPDGDLSSSRQVHVTYARTRRRGQPVSDSRLGDRHRHRSDRRLVAARRSIANGPRYDLFAFPGCASKFGSLDIGFVRLPRSGRSTRETAAPMRCSRTSPTSST